MEADAVITAMWVLVACAANTYLLNAKTTRACTNWLCLVSCFVLLRFFEVNMLFVVVIYLFVRRCFLLRYDYYYMVVYVICIL